MEVLLSELKEKPDIKMYSDRAKKSEDMLQLLLEISEKEKSAAKYTAEKIIRQVSEEEPEMLVPYIEKIIDLSDDDNAFIKLGFVKTLANVIQASKAELPQARDHYLRLLDTDSIAVFGNVLSGINKVIERYPESEEYVLLKVLAVDDRKFLSKGLVSPECIDVAKGHIIDFFFEIYQESSFKREMMAFVQNNVENERPQVRSKCKKFVKSHS